MSEALLSNFGLEQKSIVIYCNDQGVIYLILNLIYHKETK